MAYYLLSCLAWNAQREQHLEMFLERKNVDGSNIAGDLMGYLPPRAARIWVADTLKSGWDSWRDGGKPKRSAYCRLLD